MDRVHYFTFVDEFNLVIYCGDATRDPYMKKHKNMDTMMTKCDRIQVHLFEMSDPSTVLDIIRGVIDSNIHPDRNPNFEDVILDIYLEHSSWIRDDVLCDFANFRCGRHIKYVNVYYGKYF